MPTDMVIDDRVVFKKTFISLRVKLLIGCSLVFCTVFGGAYYWFYSFATHKALTRVQSDLANTARGTALGIDVDQLLALYSEGVPNQDGFSDDIRYQIMLDWVEAIHQVEPRAWPYTYVVVENEQSSIREFHDDEEVTYPHTRYLVDVWANHDVDSAAAFLEVGNASAPTMQAYRTGELVFRDLYGDKFGRWLSAYLPLKTNNGTIVAILGVDIEADYISQIQGEIRNKMLVAFFVSYTVLILSVTVISGLLTTRLKQITKFAKKVGTGNYSEHLNYPKHDRFSDEMEILADVLNNTIDNIRRREEVIQKGKEVESEIRAELESEKELNDLKSRFVSMISHELRTPLTVIQTSNEMLDKFYERLNEEKRNQYLSRVRDSVKNMTNLLEDVLFLGKAESGKIPFSPQEVDLIEYCTELVEEMELSDRDSHTIAFTCVGQVEPAFMDLKCLRSILTNLISNAFKYSAPSSQVDLNLIFQDPIVIIEVRDRGIGIPDKDQPNLFDRFHRASNVKNIRGTDLGLSIVAQCVQKQQGEIDFWSKENLGTIFNIKLPLKIFGDSPILESEDPARDETDVAVLLEYHHDNAVNSLNN